MQYRCAAKLLTPLIANGLYVPLLVLSIVRQYIKDLSRTCCLSACSLSVDKQQAKALHMLTAEPYDLEC